MLFRPPLLPEDLRYIGVTAIDITVQFPQLASWLQKVFAVMGGFIAGCGVLVIVATYDVRFYRVSAGIALGFAGLLTVANMSITNFLLDSDFKWLLMTPPLLWSLALICYFIGMRKD